MIFSRKGARVGPADGKRHRRRVAEPEDALLDEDETDVADVAAPDPGSGDPGRVDRVRATWLRP